MEKSVAVEERVIAALRQVVASKSSRLNVDERIQSIFQFKVHLSSLELERRVDLCVHSVIPLDRSRLAGGVGIELVFENMQADDRLVSAAVDALVDVCRLLESRSDVFFKWATERLHGSFKRAKASVKARDARKKSFILQVLVKVFQSDWCCDKDNIAVSEQLGCLLEVLAVSLSSAFSPSALSALDIVLVMKLAVSNYPSAVDNCFKDVVDSLIQVYQFDESTPELRDYIYMLLHNLASHWSDAVDYARAICCDLLISAFTSNLDQDKFDSSSLPFQLFLVLFEQIVDSLIVKNMSIERLFVAVLKPIFEQSWPISLQAAKVFSRWFLGHDTYPDSNWAYKVAFRVALDPKNEVDDNSASELVASFLELPTCSDTLLMWISEQMIEKVHISLSQVPQSLHDLIAHQIYPAGNSTKILSHIDNLERIRTNLMENVDPEEFFKIPVSVSANASLMFLSSMQQSIVSSGLTETCAEGVCEFITVCYRKHREELRSEYFGNHSAWVNIRSALTLLEKLAPDVSAAAFGCIIDTLSCIYVDADCRYARISVSILQKLTAVVKRGEKINFASLNDLINRISMRLGRERSYLFSLLDTLAAINCDFLSAANHQLLLQLAFDMALERPKIDGGRSSGVFKALNAIPDTVDHVRKLILQCTFTGTFRQQHFMPVFSWMMGFESGVVDGEDLFYATSMHLYFEANDIEKFKERDFKFWLASEMARFLVLSKLKSVLASPQVTLEYMEEALAELLLSFKSGRLSPNDALRLDFFTLVFHHLDLLINSAIRGPFVSNMPPSIPAAPIVAFFVTNSNSCQEWLNRLRNAMLGVCSIAMRLPLIFASYWCHFVATYGFARLSELFINSAKSLESGYYCNGAVDTIFAMAQLGLHENIQDVTKVLHPKLTKSEREDISAFADIMSAFSQNHFEGAIDLLRKYQNSIFIEQMEIDLKYVKTRCCHVIVPILSKMNNEELELEPIVDKLSTWDVNLKEVDNETGSSVPTLLSIGGLECLRVFSVASCHCLNLLMAESLSPNAIRVSLQGLKFAPFEAVAKTLELCFPADSNDRILAAKYFGKCKNFKIQAKVLDFALEKDCTGMVEISKAKSLLRLDTVNYGVEMLLNLVSKPNVEPKVISKAFTKLGMVSRNELVRQQILSFKPYTKAVSDSIPQLMLDKATESDQSNYKAWKLKGNIFYRSASRLIEAVYSWKPGELNAGTFTQLLAMLENDAQQQRLRTCLIWMSGDKSSPIEELESIDDVQDLLRAMSVYVLGYSNPEAKVGELKSLVEKFLEEFTGCHFLAADCYANYVCRGGESEKPTKVMLVILRILKSITKLAKFDNNGRLWKICVDLSQKSSVFAKVIPQLLSRLEYPEKKVANYVSHILKMLCSSSCDTLLFHVAKSVNLSVNRAAIAEVMKVITKVNPVSASQIFQVFDEMNSVSVLPEEKLFKLLQYLETSARRRLDNLRQLVAKRPKNVSSFQIEYESLIKPLGMSLGNQVDSINRMDLTDTHRQRLEDLLLRSSSLAARLMKPDLSAFAASLTLLLAEFAELMQVFRTYFAQNSAIGMSSISPFLASLSNSSIPIPGVTGEYIAGFHEKVDVLNTKTKPKRISIISSEGNVHPFLIKGMEDLHLDERMMQTLSVINDMLNDNCMINRRPLQAINYAVMPLNRRCGLIQLVQNTTSFFSLYRKWQVRETATQSKSLTGEAVPSKACNTRPNEYWRSIVNRKLAEASFSISKSRNTYPTDILISAYNYIAAEVPDSLLADEITYSSPSSIEMLIRKTKLSKSIAVMSIIGYIVGLGDRHADNILFDFDKADIVHIDYNICFEKGLNSLHVPELVPFRMTQNFVSALGPAGIDGTFRSTCECVLSILKTNKEVLLTLMEAFVFDPLIDWKSATGETNIVQEADISTNINVSRALFEAAIQKINEFNQMSVQTCDDVQYLLHGQLLREGTPFLAKIESAAATRNTKRKEYVDIFNGGDSAVRKSHENLQAIRKSALENSQRYIKYTGKIQESFSTIKNSAEFRNQIGDDHSNEIYKIADHDKEVLASYTGTCRFLYDALDFCRIPINPELNISDKVNAAVDILGAYMKQKQNVAERLAVWKSFDESFLLPSVDFEAVNSGYDFELEDSMLDKLASMGVACHVDQIVARLLIDPDSPIECLDSLITQSAPIYIVDSSVVSLLVKAFAISDTYTDYHRRFKFVKESTGLLTRISLLCHELFSFVTETGRLACAIFKSFEGKKKSRAVVLAMFGPADDICRQINECLQAIFPNSLSANDNESLSNLKGRKDKFFAALDRFVANTSRDFGQEFADPKMFTAVKQGMSIRMLLNGNGASELIAELQNVLASYLQDFCLKCLSMYIAKDVKRLYQRISADIPIPLPAMKSQQCSVIYSIAKTGMINAKHADDQSLELLECEQREEFNSLMVSEIRDQMQFFREQSMKQLEHRRLYHAKLAYISGVVNTGLCKILKSRKNLSENLQQAAEVLIEFEKDNEVAGKMCQEAYELTLDFLNRYQTVFNDSVSYRMEISSLTVVIDDQSKELGKLAVEKGSVFENFTNACRQEITRFDKQFSKPFAILTTLLHHCRNSKKFKNVESVVSAIISTRSNFVKAIEKSEKTSTDVANIFRTQVQLRVCFEQFLKIFEEVDRLYKLWDARSLVESDEATAGTATEESQQVEEEEDHEFENMHKTATFEQNQMALNVIRRIRHKLEGRDAIWLADKTKKSLGAGQELSVADQVDMVIRAATDKENLAKIYEGWMPWI